MIAAIAAYGWQSAAVDLRDVHAASDATKESLVYDASRCVEHRVAYSASHTSLDITSNRAAWASDASRYRPACAPTKIRSVQ